MRVALKERSQVCETHKYPCVGEHDSSHRKGDMASLQQPKKLSYRVGRLGLHRRKVQPLPNWSRYHEGRQSPENTPPANDAANVAPDGCSKRRRYRKAG